MKAFNYLLTILDICGYKMNIISQDPRKCMYFRRINGNTKCLKDKNYQGCWYYNHEKEICPNFKPRQILKIWR